MTSKCPCNSDKLFDACCGQYISGDKKSPTAEATMRARYTSFAVGNIDFIESTYNPDDLDSFDRKEVKEWSEKSNWKGLEIIDTQDGKETDSTGIVEFKAHYEVDGMDNAHHEVSEFKKIDGMWYFMEGKVVRNQVIRSSPKIGRNDPCSCGSGKKFKKCCL